MKNIILVVILGIMPSLALADGVIFTSDIKSAYKDVLKKMKIPVLECFLKQGFEQEYLDFYNKFLIDEDK